MNAFNDAAGLGEPEQDANSALIELDKGFLIFKFICLHEHNLENLNKVNEKNTFCFKFYYH